MFLATCRASILRAASTSSSWAARMRGGEVGEGSGGSGKEEDCGPRLREQKGEHTET